MVCPVNKPRKPVVPDSKPVGNPNEVTDLLEALRSPDPEVRRMAARSLEVSSLGALNTAETWRETNKK